MILLIWLYATGLALLIGGVINAEIERSSRNDQGPLDRVADELPPTRNPEMPVKLGFTVSSPRFSLNLQGSA